MEIPKDLIERIINYLGSKPWAEVNDLMTELLPNYNKDEFKKTSLTGKQEEKEEDK